MIDGYHAEQLAVEFLRRRGHTIVQRNYRCKLGEIDIISQHHGMLIFAEVRARSVQNYASAAESITRKKQMRIIRTAQYYLQQHSNWEGFPCRFDVLTLGANSAEDLQWLQSAFTL